jgi:hypothetical protein
MESPDAAKLPPVPPSLEVIAIKGIGEVNSGSEKIACYAMVVSPESNNIKRGGKAISCDRMLSFYDFPCAFKRHRPIEPEEKVSLEQGDAAAKLCVGNDVYQICVQKGKRLVVVRKDFSALASEISMFRTLQIRQYVANWLNARS